MGESGTAEDTLTHPDGRDSTVFVTVGKKSVSHLVMTDSLRPGGL